MIKFNFITKIRSKLSSYCRLHLAGMTINSKPLTKGSNDATQRIRYQDHEVGPGVGPSRLKSVLAAIGVQGSNA